MATAACPRHLHLSHERLDTPSGIKTCPFQIDEVLPVLRPDFVCSSALVTRSNTLPSRRTLKNSRLVCKKDDVHVCIMCLRAIMNYQVKKKKNTTDMTQLSSILHSVNLKHGFSSSVWLQHGDVSPSCRQRDSFEPQQQERQVHSPQSQLQTVQHHNTTQSEALLLILSRTKALVLELLAAVCLVRGGHEIILSAFDNFKTVRNEKRNQRSTRNASFLH